MTAGRAVEIPVPPGVSAWDTAMALTAALVERWHAEVMEVHDLLDGAICIDVRVQAGRVRARLGDGLG